MSALARAEGETRGSLALELSALPVERAGADLLVVPVFCDERPLRGAAGRADWRLCGRLSELAAAGRLTGGEEEAVLVSTFGGLAAPLVLALGVGHRARFDGARLESLAAEAVRRALSLRCAALALALPERTEDGAGLGERVERLLVGAAAALAERSSPCPAKLRLLLLVPQDELTRTAECLRTGRPRLPVAVSLHGAAADRPGPRPRLAQAVEEAFAADVVK